MQANKEDLILFDIDGTLILPVDQALRPGGTDFFLKHFRILAENASLDELEQLASKILQQRIAGLVDKELPALIKELQSHTKIIASTAFASGPYGVIKSMEAWRHQELLQLGFDFSTSFPSYNHIIFGDFKHDKGLAIFKDGILYTAQQSKEELLAALWRYAKWRPQRLFIVDDSLKQLEALQAHFQTIGIEITCLHYRQAESLPNRFDEGIAQQQFKHLSLHGTWIGDDQISLVESKTPPKNAVVGTKL